MAFNASRRRLRAGSGPVLSGHGLIKVRAAGPEIAVDTIRRKQEAEKLAQANSRELACIGRPRRRRRAGIRFFEAERAPQRDVANVRTLGSHLRFDGTL